MEQGTLGKRIAYHRKRLGMTQEQLAQRVGVSAQAVSSADGCRSGTHRADSVFRGEDHSAGACLHLRHQRG